MAYRVCYSPEDNKRYPEVNKQGSGRGARYIAIISAVVLALSIPKVRDKLWMWLIPGDEAVTSGAFTQMVEDIQSGNSVADAVTVFCQEILDHGNEAAFAYQR